jgi:DNA repair protein RecO (recombination protein O)
MSIQKTEAILLRRQDLRETSLVATFYTRDFGKIKGVMKGVRGMRAPCGTSALEIFARDEIVFYERRHSEFYTVSQCDLIDFFPSIRADLIRLAHASYLVELLDSVTVLGDRNAAAFELLLNSLDLMAGEASPRRIARVFEIRLLSLLGMMPAVEQCVNCGARPSGWAAFSFKEGGVLCERCFRPESDRDARRISLGTVKFIERVKSSPFGMVSRIKVSQDVGTELEMILRRFLDYHIERRLRTLKFLKDIQRT